MEVNDVWVGDIILPKQLSNKVKEDIDKLFNKPVRVRKVKSVTGGCINTAVRLITDSGDFFLKWNEAGKFPEMFEKEVKGLGELKASDTFRIPEVITYGVADKCEYLLLKFVPSAPQTPDFWETFGKDLAALHKNTRETFGLDFNNYIGSLPQSNRNREKWLDFFISERIEPQLRLARNSGAVDKTLSNKFINLFNALEEVFPDEPPALLHGDLWSGNYLVDDNGLPCLVDPSVYYGHREMELAFTKLFGGFDARMYRSYEEIFPLEPGFYDRQDFYNLYPLLVHVNLFGGNYLLSVKSILRKF